MHSKDTDPDLPSYLCDEYLEQRPRWALANKVFDGPEASTIKNYAVYLPQDSQEPPKAYSKRLHVSAFLWEPKYRRAIEGFAGILSSVHGNAKIPRTLVEKWNDIDLQGTSIATFVQEAAVNTGKFGGCFVLVDYSGQPVVDGTAADEKEQRTPYLVRYSPEDVINWRFEIDNGKKKLVQCTIVELVEIPEGKYGSIVETIYRVFTPGLCETFRIEEIEGKKQYVAVLIEEPREMNDRSGKALTEIPITYVAAAETTNYNIRSPMDQIAYLNIHLWQVESDRHNVMHLCNLPTPCLGDKDLGTDTQGNPIKRTLVLGPNSWISHSESGKFYFAEPSGAALEQTRQKVQDVKEAINQLVLEFLADEMSNTATEAELKAIAVKANLQGMARQINSSLASIKRHWCMYTLENDTGELTVSETAIEKAMSPEGARLILDMIDGRKLTYKSGMAILQEGKVIPESIDLEEEVAELIAEKPLAVVPSIGQAK